MPAPNGRNRIDISQIDPASLDGGTSAVKIATSDASPKITGHYVKYDDFARLTDGGIPSSDTGDSNYGHDTGTANAYAVTLPAAVTVGDGTQITIRVLHTNTDASTLAVNSGADIAIKKESSSGLVDLALGDWRAGQEVIVVHDGTLWQWIGTFGLPPTPILDTASTIPICDADGNWIYPG